MSYAVWAPTVVAIAFSAVSAVASGLPAGNPVTIDDVTNIVAIIAQFMVVTSMIVAVACIVLGGIMVMTAQGDSSRFKTGTAWVKNVAIGAGVVLGTGVIINTVASVVDRTFFCQISLLGICLY